MSLINDALKNIDERSRDQISTDIGLISDSLMSSDASGSHFGMQDSGNDEHYSSRTFSFPFLCFIFIAAWGAALVHTLMAVDVNNIEKIGLLAAISNTPKKTVLQATKDIGFSSPIMFDVFTPGLHGNSSNLKALSLGREGMLEGNHFSFDPKDGLLTNQVLPMLDQNKVELVEVVIKEEAKNRPTNLAESNGQFSVSRKKTLNKDFENVNFFKEKFYIAINDDRLTLPKDDSAWYYLSEIKKINADSLFYTQGLTQLKDRYGVLIDESLASEKLTKAKTYLQRLVAISSNKDSSNKGTSNKNGIERYHSKISVAEDLKENIFRQRLSIEKSEVPFATTIAIAKQHVSSGRLIDAESLLEKAINSSDASEATLASVELWFDVLLKLNRFNRAQTVHETVLKYSWRDLWDDSYKQALLLSYKHDHDTALRFLATKNSNDLSENALRFFAGLYQKESAYNSAKETYKKLLDKFGDSSTYWLGYAVSSDALLEKHIALDAFRKTRAIGGLTPSLTSYVNDRIKALAEGRGDTQGMDSLKLSSRKNKKGPLSW